MSDDPTGEAHKRHRAVAPAFGLVGTRALLPYFTDAVTKARELRFHLVLEADSGPRYQMAEKWIDIIETSESGRSATIDVSMWLGKATLDAYVLELVLVMHWLRVNDEPFSKESVQELSRLWCPG